jgi:hypothetical protein
MKPKPFQFGLASLLWLILVVAILIGWYRDRRQLILEHEQERVRAARQQAELRIQLYREQQNRRMQSGRVYRSTNEFSAPISDWSLPASMPQN